MKAPPTLSRQALAPSVATLCAIAVFATLQAAEPGPKRVVPGAGLFNLRADIGNPFHAGQLHYDPVAGSYTLSGGGANMWFERDDFHFAWSPCSGDVVLTAEIRWSKPGGNAHRKACLMFRQDLDSDSAYVDAALHGDGLVSLQFREFKGAATREIQANLNGPLTLRLERCDGFIWMSLGFPGQSLQAAGGAVRLALKDPVLVGLGVCAHDDRVLEEAVFSNIRLERLPHVAAAKPDVQSTLEIVDIASKDRRSIYTARALFEAPNWSPDGQYFVFNQAGRIFRLPTTGGTPEPLDTGFAGRCNNDHGFSPDGRLLAISDQTESGKSLIYVLPASGGPPRKVTTLAPSYWHGWSPDGRTLTYCAERGGEYDVYSIPVAGGTESRLTITKGLDDGPEYSPDGRWIYFNSERTGRMQVWRIHPDGSAPEQVTRGESNDWFPHPSPDGKWIVYLAYGPDVQGHPPNQDVELRLLSVDGREPQILARLFGGQGTLNVPSWSSDSRKVAFVSYRLIHHTSSVSSPPTTPPSL